MVSADLSVSRAAHDILRVWNDFKDLVAVGTQVTVPAQVSIFESQDVPELVSQCPGTVRLRTEHDTAGAFHMSRSGSRRQAATIPRKEGDVLSQIQGCPSRGSSFSV